MPHPPTQVGQGPRGPKAQVGQGRAPAIAAGGGVGRPNAGDPGNYAKTVRTPTGKLFWGKDIQVTDIIKQLYFKKNIFSLGVWDLFKNDWGGRGSVLTKYEPVASHGDPFRGRIPMRHIKCDFWTT